MVAGRILVIDDDESTRRALQRLLGAAGLPSAAYASGEEVLASDAWKDAACVVSDMKLTGMSGFELLTELRSRHVKAPFILITAHDLPRIRAEALARGAGYLAKPFLGPDLLDAIDLALERTRPS